MIDETLFDAEEKMEKAVHVARDELGGLRTGRANASAFARLVVDYYGSPTPLQQLASFTAPEPRVIIISPYDASAMSAIEKSIRDSDLGVNPSNDGKTIRVTLPQLTEQRRKEYAKLAKSKAEDARISVRGARRSAKEALDKMVKDKEVGEDEVTRAEKQLDAATKKHTDAIDDVLKHKEAELLEV